MNLADFNIGEKFVTATGEWLCTDKGTRVAVGIKLDKSDTGWYNGPPYAVAEAVFDEYDMQGCWQTQGEYDAAHGTNERR